jgi:hypothetical protein
MLVVLSGLLLIPAVLTLARIVRVRQPRLGAVVGAWTVAACIGIACIGIVCVGAKSLVMGQVVRYSPPEVAATVWSHVALDMVFIDLLNLLGALGFIALAVGIFRSRVVPRAAAILVGFGGLTTLVTAEGPIRPLLATAAGILLIDLAWIAVAIAPSRAPSTNPAPVPAPAPAPSR